MGINLFNSILPLIGVLIGGIITGYVTITVSKSNLNLELRKMREDYIHKRILVLEDAINDFDKLTYVEVKGLNNEEIDKLKIIVLQNQFKFTSQILKTKFHYLGRKEFSELVKENNEINSLIEQEIFNRKTDIQTFYRIDKFNDKIIKLLQNKLLELTETLD